LRIFAKSIVMLTTEKRIREIIRMRPHPKKDKETEEWLIEILIPLFKEKIEEEKQKEEKRFSALATKDDLARVIEIMTTRFEVFDQRFEAINQRFEILQREMDKRFETVDKRFAMIQWAIGVGFIGLTILMSIYKFIN